MTGQLNGIMSQLEQQKTAIERALEALRALSATEVPAPHLSNRATRAEAEDHGAKPFQKRDASSSQSDQVISIGDVELHPARRLVLRAGKPVHLTPKAGKKPGFGSLLRQTLLKGSKAFWPP